ncbi:hypothetical protein KSP39_PZI016880 [Platanthera zijinensis]|uniref:C2H2-type domain-containing protein n=1 Tax=Platanthera zijinensis TaxID=2320716 RepID=A0AAP0G0F6_9ASPA
MMETSVKGNDEQCPIFRDIRRYYCEHCGICRSKKSLIRSHILSQHKDELDEAKLDEISAPKAGQKIRHICEECGASFWKPAYLMQHMRSHSAQRLFTCPLEDCLVSYRRKDHLNRHLLKHQGKVFNCPIDNCCLTFSFQCNMKRHVKELHDDESPCEVADCSPCSGEKKHVCGEPGCEKSFKYLSKLKKHAGSHVQLESVELYCGEPGCFKAFTNADCLKAHVQSFHKYIKCEVCCSQQLKKNIKRHRRMHEGFAREKIKCSFEGCEHEFSSKSNLSMHVKAAHQDLRPFSCRTSGCAQKFTYKHVRDNHELTHVYIQGDFLEADERRMSILRGGRKRQRITVETLMRKRIVSLDPPSVFDDGADYLRWMLSDDAE